ncbi:MAG TPA: hypothetical protein VEQ41_07005 [Solirubrobacterales bacterium]|nr:hypothetical protein [Solirubrobacterales bacterium]
MLGAATLNRHGDVDPVVLTELFALVLESDRSFRGYVEKKNRNAARLRSRDGWREVCTAAAARVVEKYLHLDQEVEADGALPVTREDLRARVLELADYAADRGVEADALLSDDRGVDRYDPPTSHRPELREVVVNRVQAILADEMVIFTPARTGIGIPQEEKDREVAKRALARLKLTELREIAEREGLSPDGAFEQVAQRISEHHENRGSEIARLVLAYEEEVPERGFTTRLLPLFEPPSLEQVATRLAVARGRYVRIGIARWLVVRGLEARVDEVNLDGELRYYTVYPKCEYDAYELADKPREAHVDVRFRQGARWMEISSRIGHGVNAMGMALEQAAGLRSAGGLEIGMEIPEGPLLAWDPRTAFMVAFLARELVRAPVSLLDLAMVQFETQASAPDNPRRPAVRSVRLGGQHLMSSRPACELVVAGRALVTIQARIAVVLEDESEVVCPIRVELNDEFATLHTGFTDVPVAKTRQAHELLLGRLRQALDNPRYARSAAVGRLAIQVRGRASEENPEEADILPPPGTEGAEEDDDSNAEGQETDALAT